MNKSISLVILFVLGLALSSCLPPANQNNSYSTAPRAKPYGSASAQRTQPQSNERSPELAAASSGAEATTDELILEPSVPGSDVEPPTDVTDAGTSGATVESGASSAPDSSVAKSQPVPKSQSYPYGTPVPGKKGFVYSPYNTSGQVDVRGVPSGALIEDPYTKKYFRVP